MEHKDHSSYELVVVKHCVKSLLNRLRGLALINNYNLFALAINDIRIYGIKEATRRARSKTIDNAAEIIYKGYNPKTEEYYRNVIKKAG